MIGKVPDKLSPLCCCWMVPNTTVSGGWPSVALNSPTNGASPISLMTEIPVLKDLTVKRFYHF